MTLLVYVPISNRAWAVPRFLKSLMALEYPDDVSFYFNVNDSRDETSSLLGIQGSSKRWEVFENTYGVTPQDHVWDEPALHKMVKIRNHALATASEKKADWLFMVDSDILFEDSQTLTHLLLLQKPIVSPVFWATWGRPGAEPLPNVWKRGQYESDATFRNLLWYPGHYPVGGLGAVTLIHKSVWEMGVTYSPIKNLCSHVMGEDRYFCIRAVAAGFELTACTCCPVKHMER